MTDDYCQYDPNDDRDDDTGEFEIDPFVVITDEEE